MAEPPFGGCRLNGKQPCSAQGVPPLGPNVHGGCQNPPTLVRSLRMNAAAQLAHCAASLLQCLTSAVRMLTPWVGPHPHPTPGPPTPTPTPPGGKGPRGPGGRAPSAPLGPFGAQGGRLYATTPIPNGIDNKSHTCRGLSVRLGDSLIVQGALCTFTGEDHRADTETKYVGTSRGRGK